MFLCDRSSANFCNFEFGFYLSSKKKGAFIKSVKLVLFEGKLTKFVAITYPRGFCYAVEKIRNFAYVRYVREDFG